LRRFPLQFVDLPRGEEGHADYVLPAVLASETRASLSYIFTCAWSRRCLMQVPSMRVEKREPISWASCGVIWQRACVVHISTGRRAPQL
jgi:hypothetical protein